MKNATKQQAEHLVKAREKAREAYIDTKFIPNRAYTSSIIDIYIQNRQLFYNYKL